MQGIEYFINQGFERGFEQGFERGFERGMLNNAGEMVIEALQEHFGEIPGTMIDEIRSIGKRETLKKLLRQTIRCRDLESFQKVLANEKV